MAEAFANADGRVEAISAGTEPAEYPHPEVVAVMEEVGLDVSNHEGLMLTNELVESADRVITMGCAVDSDACPAILYAGVEDWGLEDPKGKDMDRVREIRDEIRVRVHKLLEEMDIS